MQTTSYFSWVSNDTIDFEIACLSSELQSEKFDKCNMSIYFFNKDISFNITCMSLRFHLPFFYYVMEGTVSQISFI